MAGVSSGRDVTLIIYFRFSQRKKGLLEESDEEKGDEKKEKKLEKGKGDESESESESESSEESSDGDEAWWFQTRKNGAGYSMNCAAGKRKKSKEEGNRIFD